MSALISPQMLGRYMKAAACRRAMTPQYAYFLTSGLQMAQSRLYQSFSLSVGVACEEKQQLAAFENCLSFHIKQYHRSIIIRIQLGGITHRCDVPQKLYNKLMMVILILTLLVSCTLNINQQCAVGRLGQDWTGLGRGEDGNQTCPLHAHCLQNNYCACDSGYIGGCTQQAYEMQDGAEVSTTLTNNDYTFFSITQEVDAYVVLIFTLCHQTASLNNQSIDVWQDRGDYSTINKSNSLPGGRDWEIREGCTKLSTPLMVFGSQQNGLSENFILGIKLAKEGSIAITMQLEIDVFDFWDLLAKFLFILGGIFLLIFLLTLAVFIFKWRRGRLGRLGRTVQVKDISHFDNFMPKYKMNSENRYRTHDQSCAVCLLELGDGDWLRKTICNHIFHQDCLDAWCRSNLNCPICRRSFQLRDLEGDFSTFQTVPQSSNMRNPLIV